MSLRLPVFSLGALCFAGAFCLCGAQIRQGNFGGRSYYNLYDIARLNNLSLAPRFFAARVSGANFTGDFRDKERKFNFNGVKIALNAPIKYSWGCAMISAADWKCNLRPLFYPGTLKKHSISLITIDMGHGGSDPGALGAISKEKNINLRIGLRVAEILHQCGYRVHLTRNRDVQIPLAQVDQLQRNAKSDLFVSIHVNAAANRALSGIETFCLTPAGEKSSNAGKNSAPSHLGNRNDANNIYLAYQIQHALLRRTGASDHGVKRARFAVLREISAPGVLVEVGFISNPAEERRLNDSAYIEKIARGIVDGIIVYHRTIKIK